MSTVSTSLEVPAGPAAVWEVLADLSRYPEWNVPHMGFPDGVPTLAEGAAFKETVRILNVGGDVDWTVAAVEPERRIELHGVGMMGVKLVQTYALEPAGDRTLVTASTEMQGAAFKVMFKAIEKSAVEALEETVGKLGGLVVGDRP